MYCKHCGKEIADDSKFCQHCGGKQEDSFASPTNNEVKSEEPKKQEKVIEIPIIKTNLSANQKKWIGIYVAWALLNFIFIFIKGTYDGSNRYFFPFQASGRNTWDLEYYDFSEFLVYAILLPLIVFFIYKYIEKISKYIEKISKILNSGGSNLPDNM
mgnify:CR=1 FL=1